MSAAVKMKKNYMKNLEYISTNENCSQIESVASAYNMYGHC